MIKSNTKNKNLILITLAILSFANFSAIAGDIEAADQDANAVFINTNKLEGRDDIGLQLRDSDSSVTTAKGTPAVIMRLDQANKLVVGAPKGTIKIQVFRTTDNANEIVGVYNYPVRANQTKVRFKINLPKFYNQSENYLFVVHDTNGIAQAKYEYSFSARELVSAPDTTGPIDDVDEALFSQAQMDYLAKKISVVPVSSNAAVGVEKNASNDIVLKVPFASNNSGTVTGARKVVSNLNIDASGASSQRALYDNSPKGFVFLDETIGSLYFKKTKLAGDWSEAILLQGPKGEKGDAAIFDPTKIPNGAISLNNIVGGSELVGLASEVNKLKSSKADNASVLSVINSLSDRSTVGLNNLTNVAINTSLLPAASNAIDLGSSSKQMKNGFFSGDVRVAGVIKTNYTKDKAVSLTLKESMSDNGAVLGYVAGGAFPVLRLGSGSYSSSAWTVRTPKDLYRNNPSANTVKVKVTWSPSNNSGSNVDLKLSYSSYNSGEVVNSTVNSLSTSVVAPAQTLEVLTTEFNIPLVDVKDSLMIKLARTDASSLNVNIMAVNIEYPALSVEEI